MKIQKGSISVDLSLEELSDMLDNNQAEDFIAMILDLAQADREMSNNPFLSHGEYDEEQGYQIIEVDASEIGSMNEFIQKLMNVEGFEVIEMHEGSPFTQGTLESIFGPVEEISEDELTILRIIDRFEDIVEES